MCGCKSDAFQTRTYVIQDLKQLFQTISMNGYIMSQHFALQTMYDASQYSLEEVTLHAT